MPSSKKSTSKKPLKKKAAPSAIKQTKPKKKESKTVKKSSKLSPKRVETKTPSKSPSSKRPLTKLSKKQQPTVKQYDKVKSTRPASKTKAKRTTEYVTAGGFKLKETRIRTKVSDAITDAKRLKIDVKAGRKRRQYIIKRNGVIVFRTHTGKDNQPEAELLKMARKYSLKGDEEIELLLIY